MRISFLVFAVLVGVSTGSAHAACPAGTTPGASAVEGKPSCIVKGNYLKSNLSLTAANAYLLEGDVRIGSDNANPSTLSVEPGTKIYGTLGSYLVIMRGSKVFLNGTKTQPVVFTSLERSNFRPGMWGGIVINGNAPINSCKAGATVCEAISEGIKVDPPKFGGNNPSDSSGSLKYVRVEYAGFELSKDNELNGITFNGVGNGTIVDFVQVHMSADDGVEFFGGTVNAKHLVLTQSDDDGFDFDMGYVGNVQFVLIDMAVGNEDMNGIEGDNLKSPMDAQPRSNPTLSNFTIIARGPNARMFNGVLLRRGASASMHNFIVTGDFKTGCVNFDDEETFKTGALSSGAGLTQTGLKMESSLVFCTAGNHFRQEATDPWSIAQWFTSDGRKANKTIDPMLQGWLPMENSPAVGMGVVPKLSGSFQFTAVDYAGAFSPFEDENWTAGWTVR